jgi:hypothetical protein
MLRSTREDVTPLQKRLERTGELFGLIAILIAAVMIGTIVVAEYVTGFAAIFDVATDSARGAGGCGSARGIAGDCAPCCRSVYKDAATACHSAAARRSRNSRFR